MRSLQLPLRGGPAALLLVLCLQLGLNKAWENTSNRNVLNFNVDMPQEAKANEPITLKLRLETELRECMVVKAHLQSNPQIEGPFNYIYTRCVCDNEPVHILWDFQTNQTSTITVLMDIVNERDICVDDISVVPNEANQFYTERVLLIY